MPRKAHLNKRNTVQHSRSKQQKHIGDEKIACDEFVKSLGL